jgi:hypothetical protein
MPDYRVKTLEDIASPRDIEELLNFMNDQGYIFLTVINVGPRIHYVFEHFIGKPQ